MTVADFCDKLQTVGDERPSLVYIYDSDGAYDPMLPQDMDGNGSLICVYRSDYAMEYYYSPKICAKMVQSVYYMRDIIALVVSDGDYDTAAIGDD